MTEETTAPINTANDCMIGVSGDIIMAMIPIQGRIPKDKALRLAAWIVAMADNSEDHAEFNRILEAVEST